MSNCTEAQIILKLESAQHIIQGLFYDNAHIYVIVTGIIKSCYEQKIVVCEKQKPCYPEKKISLVFFKQTYPNKRTPELRSDLQCKLL